MIIMRIKCGLGNQLFQYAAAWALSKRLKQPLALFVNACDGRAFRLDKLNVLIKTIIKPEELPQDFETMTNPHVNDALKKLDIAKHQFGEWLYFQQLRDEFQDDFFLISAENIYLDGYFQCEAYFKKYRTDLLRQFMPLALEEPGYEEVLAKIKQCNSVAVHVRRGDFQLSGHMFHYLLTENYYRKAFAYIRERVESPVFFWFSEDYEWIYKTFGHENDFYFADIPSANRDIIDIMLMKNCKHIITANSTFSWWAAWLNEHKDAICIVPDKQYITEGSIPDSWVKLPV